MCSFCLTIFLVRESTLIFQRSCLFQSLIVEMKSERCQYFLFYFFIFFKFKLHWSKTQHASFNTCSPLIILYFENRNWPVERLKWLFSMVLCVNFNIWSWVYLLIVCDEVTFLWISKQDAKVKTQALSREVVSLFFLSTYFINMHNNK